MATNTDKLPPDVGGDVESSAVRDAFDVGGLTVNSTVAMICNAVRRCTEPEKLAEILLGTSGHVADALVELGAVDDEHVVDIMVNGVRIEALR